MFESPEKQGAEKKNEMEKEIFRRLRGYILGLGAVCVLSGAGIGFLVGVERTTAEKSANFAAAPETLSASFAVVAKQVEPAVVNIDTKTNAPEIDVKTTPKNDKDKSKEDDNPILEYFR